MVEPQRDATSNLSSSPADVRRPGVAIDADAAAASAAAERQILIAGRAAWLEVVRRVSRAIGHDLANVLTGISFYGSEIAADLPPGTDAEDAVAITDSVVRAAALLDELRGLWREAAEAEVVPLDPAAVVDAITALLTAAARPATLVVAPLDSMVVRASRRTLEESVLALVVDAREAAASLGTGTSGATIRVGVAVEVLAQDDVLGLDAGRYAAVLVDGDAPTPTPDEAVVSPTTPLADMSPGEPGFGLALAAAGARAAGGGVRVERTAGRGLRTTILLPIAVSRRRRAMLDGEGTGAGSEPD